MRDKDEAVQGVRDGEVVARVGPFAASVITERDDDGVRRFSERHYVRIGNRLTGQVLGDYPPGDEDVGTPEKLRCWATRSGRSECWKRVIWWVILGGGAATMATMSNIVASIVMNVLGLA